MIEHALKVNQKEDQDSDNNIDNEIVDDSDLSIEDLEKTIKDSDYEEFNDFIESELEIDELLYDEGDDE